MRALPSLAVLTVVAGTLGGCIPAASGRGDSTATTFAEELGRVSYERLRGAVDRILVGKRGFRLRRRDEQYATLYYETEWRTREPFADEAEAGVTGARSRIVIRGRRVGGEGYAVTFEGENEVRTRGDPNWHQAPVTARFRAYMSGIARELAGAIGGDG